jgi:hypothetical protein
MSKKILAAFQVLSLIVIGSLTVSSQALAQEGCTPWEGVGTLPENERLISVARDKVGTLDFSAKYTGVTVSVEGMLCDPKGDPIPGAKIHLVKYSVSPDATAGTVSEELFVEDLDYANGHPLTVIGQREAETNPNGKFRFLAVAPGKMALKVDWSELTSAPFVTWQVSWEPGPMMAVSRNVP